MAALTVVAMISIVPNIKNVIGSKEHMARGITSQHSTNKFAALKLAYG